MVDSQQAKHDYLDRVISNHALSIFIETGTHIAETALKMASNELIKAVHTIEIDPVYYVALPPHPKINYYLGRSVDLLPSIMEELNPIDDALIYLDAHYPQDPNESQVPLLEELKIISSSFNKDHHVIVIDDILNAWAQDNNEYPSRDELSAFLDEYYEDYYVDENELFTIW